MKEALRSPVSGVPLSSDTQHSLADGAGERWPVIDGIAYLRTGREALVTRVLGLLDGNREAEALTRLLADQDDWWTGPVADPECVAELVARRGSLGFGEAMKCLGFGRVGDYLAHRWSDPTYLAGLALMEAHWKQPDCAFELACGTGAYLRELSRRGVRCCGGDVVFAKLWLARHWVVGPQVELVCFDAASPWPIAGRRYALAICHDAFYFLEPKHEVVRQLREATATDGLIAIAHVHNAGHANFSAGAAVAAEALAEMFPGAVFYDDEELTHALAEARAPVPQPPATLASAEAVSLAMGDSMPPRPVLAGLALPPGDATLRRNPLYDDDGAICWPSERYRDEYAARATYPLQSQMPHLAPNGLADRAAARTRELVDLPERW